jgi:hypothetical protein
MIGLNPFVASADDEGVSPYEPATALCPTNDPGDIARWYAPENDAKRNKRYRDLMDEIERKKREHAEALETWRAANPEDQPAADDGGA